MRKVIFADQMQRLTDLPPREQQPLIRVFALLIEAAEARATARATRANAAAGSPPIAESRRTNAESPAAR